MSNLEAIHALAGAAEAARQRGQDPAQVHAQVEQLAAGSSTSSDCNTSVCGGVIAFGPAVGDVSGLGYCHDCVLSAQANSGWAAASAAESAPADGAA